MLMKFAALLTAILPLMIACNANDQQLREIQIPFKPLLTQELVLPAPDTNATKSKFSKVIGWPEGKTPVAPAGFTVTKFAEKIKSPRNIYIAPNGDVLVALSNSEKSPIEQAKSVITGKAKSEQGGESANTILLFRDTNNDGKPDVQSAFLTGLNQPYGVLIIGEFLFCRQYGWDLEISVQNRRYQDYQQRHKNS